MTLGARAYSLILIAWVAIATPAPVVSAATTDVPDRIQVQIGGTWAIFDTGAGLDQRGGALSRMLMFEDFFGIPARDGFVRLDGTWRFAPRQSVDLGYLNIERSGSRLAETDFTFGRYTYHAGAEVRGEVKTRLTYAGYRYDFLHDEELSFSGSAGLQSEQLKATVSATAGVTDQNGQVVSGVATQEENLSFPVPLLGLQLDWVPAPRFAVQAYARAVVLSVTGLRGSETDLAARGYWYFHRHAGLGIGYDKLVMDWPEYHTSGANARFSYIVDGLTLYLRGAF
jgi:hypothetical protein